MLFFNATRTYCRFADPVVRSLSASQASIRKMSTILRHLEESLLDPNVLVGISIVNPDYVKRCYLLVMRILNHKIKYRHHNHNHHHHVQS